MSKLLFDERGLVESPSFLLGTRTGEIKGYIHSPLNTSYTRNMNAPNELSFNIYKNMGAVFDDIVDFRAVYYPTMDEWLQINVTVEESEKENIPIKHVTGTSLAEAELSQINLCNVEINTEDDIARDDYVVAKLYGSSDDDIKNSILTRMLDKAPHYTLKHVDESIKNIQRKFSFNGTDLISAFNRVSDEIECIFIYGSGMSDGKPARTISVYDLKCSCKECGHRFDSGNACPECGSTDIKPGYGNDTGIVVTKDGMGEDLSYSTDDGSVKNCFRLVTGDDIMTSAVRTCNPNGTSYIWYFTDEFKNDMSKQLRDKLSEYDKLFSSYNEFSANVFFDTLATDDRKETVLSDDIGNILIFDNSTISNYNNIASLYNKPRILNSKDAATEEDVILTGYSELVSAYYNATDLSRYLTTTMMPFVEIVISGVDEQIASIKENLKEITLSKITSSTSAATVETAAESLAKLFVDTGAYKVDAVTNSYNNGTWTGSFTVTSWADDTITGTTGNMSLPVTDNMSKYIENVINKKLNDADNDNYSVSGLFKRNDASFRAELKKYSLDCLESFFNCCQTCINVLIEQGCGSTSSEMHNTMYTPWVNKLDYITAEINIRSTEIDMVEKCIGALSDEIQNTHKVLNFQNFIGDDLWKELISFRREDDYKNDNYISDGLTNKQLVANARDFYDAAYESLIKSATLQHSITGSLKNFLAIKEFSNLRDMFEEGNWIYTIIDEKPYKLRLLSYTIDFGRIQNLSVQFSDVMMVGGGLSDVRSVLDSAKSVASSYGDVKRQAKTGDEAADVISDWVNDGLDATHTKIVNSARNQTILIDENGLLGRQYDDITDSYYDEQVRLFNSTIAFTDDGWKTTRTAVGKFLYVDPEDGQTKESYGVIANTLVGDLILSKEVGIYNSSGKIRLTDEGITIRDASGNTTFAIDGATGGVSLLGNITWGEGILPDVEVNRENIIDALNSEGTTDGIYAFTGDDGKKYIGINAAAIKAGKISVDRLDLNVISTKTDAQGYANSALKDAKDFTESYTESYTKSQGYLTATSEEITSKLSKTDYTGATISSLINQSAEGVTIDGNKIDLRGKVVASDVVVGDYSNLVTINPKFPVTYTGGAFATFNKGTSTGMYNNTPYLSVGSSASYLMLCDYTPICFSSGDKIRFDGIVPNWGETFNSNFQLWLYDSNHSYVRTAYSTVALSKQSWNNVSAEITVPDLTNAVYFLIGFTKPTDRSIGVVHGAYCRRKINGQMIVDGSISADQIDVDSLFANVVNSQEINVMYSNSGNVGCELSLTGGEDPNLTLSSWGKEGSLKHDYASINLNKLSVNIDAFRDVSLSGKQIYVGANYTEDVSIMADSVSVIADNVLLPKVTVSGNETVSGSLTVSGDCNFITHANEFNFVPATHNSGVYFNYRGLGGNAKVALYTFCNGSGGYAPIYASAFYTNAGFTAMTTKNIQYGSATISFYPSTTGAVTVKFSTAFTSKPTVIVTQVFDSYNIVVKDEDISTSQFTARVPAIGSTGSRAFRWVAIGS